MNLYKPPFASPEDRPNPSIGHNQRVLPGRADVTAEFGQDIWDLSGADHHDGRDENELKISFEYISGSSIKLALKELAYHRLNTRLSSETRRLSPYTCAREQQRLKRFVRWLREFHPRVESLSTISQSVVHAYHMWLAGHREEDELAGVTGGNHRASGEAISAETVWSYMSPIKSLALYADYLTEPMNFSPYNGRLSASFCGVQNKKGQNSTPIIPDAVLHPVITVAMRYVEHYHVDLEAMVQDVIAFWQQVEEKGRNTPWPGWKATISSCPTLDKPWRPVLGQADHHVNHEFRSEMAHLQAACTSVILYLSGLRPGEFCTLQSGCLRSVTDPKTGEVVRWKIRGIPLKKRQTGEFVDWVIPKAAAEAVQVLERLLQPFRERHGCDNLALNLDAFRPYPEKTRKDFSLKGRSMQGQITGFLSMITDRFQMPIEGTLMPSQFRRTLARHIARQPFGVIAGKLQYHHVKTVVFEGYAGARDDGFRDEVDDEEYEAAIDLIDEMEQDDAEGALLGPGAAGVLQEIRAAKKTVLGQALSDTSEGEAALKASLKSLAKRIHVAFLNFCVFNPERALCLTTTQAAEADAEPRINQCAPDRCGNSVVGACHVPLWQELLDEVAALRKAAKSPLQRASLDQQATRYQKVLAPLSKPVNAGG